MLEGMQKQQKGLSPRQQLAIAAISLGLFLLTASGVYTFRKATPPSASPPPVPLPTIKAVTALGRLEPKGEVIKVAPPPDLGGAKIEQMLVKEGEKVKAGQVIAILDTLKRKKSALKVAQEQVKVAQANLAVVKAGSKTGDLQAQAATIQRLQAELRGALATDQAKIARLQAQQKGEQAAQSATLARLEAELGNADREFQRYAILAHAGAISDSDLDQKRLTLAKARESYQEAQATYSKTLETLQEEIIEAQAAAQENQASLSQQIQAAQAQLNSLAEVRPVDVAQAQTQVDQALAALGEAQVDLEKAYIKAPIAGQILKIHSWAGEQVNASEGIVELGNTDQMMVIAEVYESDINRVQPGKKVKIKSENNTFKDELTGTVQEIGLQIGKKDVLDTDPAADVDVRVVEVKIQLDPVSSQKVSHLTYAKVISRIEE